jgi:hypothetical protein
MSAFSASDAALEGFEVLRAHWRVVVGWGVFSLLAVVALVAITVVVAVGVGLAGTGDEATATAGVIGATLDALATGLILAALVVGLYRLKLRPDDPGFLHLRLGRDEGRLFVIALIWGAALFLLAACAVALGTLLNGFISVGQILARVLVAGVGGWLALRFALTAPISFAERRIDFLASWRMTRGQVWPLLGMWFLNLCLVLLIWLALWLAVFVLSGLLTGFHGFAIADSDEALTSHPLRYLLEAIIPILCMPALLVLSQAPWVAAYRGLANPAPETPAEP